MVNIILDESGTPSNRTEKNTRNRLIGAVIFNGDVDNLRKNIEKFIKNNPTLNNIIMSKPHNIKYETLKKLTNCEKLYVLILDFLTHQRCKFYFHPVMSKDRKIPEKIDGYKHTKIILECNLDIMGNIILGKKRNKESVGNFTIYCDKEMFKKINTPLGVSIGESSFITYPLDFKEKINLENFNEHYQFDVKEMKGSNLLHNCADLISGICEENYNKHKKTNSYKKIMENLFLEWVDGCFT